MSTHNPQQGRGPIFTDNVKQTFRSLDKSLAILKWKLEFDNDPDRRRSHTSLCDRCNSGKIHHFLSWCRVRYRGAMDI